MKPKRFRNSIVEVYKTLSAYRGDIATWLLHKLIRPDFPRTVEV